MMKFILQSSIPLLLLVTSISCSTSEKQLLIDNSKKYLPSEEEKSLIIKSVEEENKNFDPAYNAIKVFTPATANHYHSKRIGMENHPTRTAANYVVDLLETGIKENQERACKVIEALLAAQDVNPENKTYGIWPYHFEEPLEDMNRPDWNWADFISVQLLEAYMQFNEIIPDDLKIKMEESIIHAARSIEKRDVKPGYTNIAIMGTLVTHLAAHLFDIQDLKEYADMRMTRFYDYTKKLNGFVEYNSPTYTQVALNELVRMKQYILDEATLEMADYCYHTGWGVLASHYHAPTSQLAGPHSRSYSTLLRDSFYDFLYGASNGQINVGNARKPDNYYKLQHRIPDDYVKNFTSVPENRVQIDTFSLNDNPPVGYTFLSPEYCFGTVNRSTTWKQRRPYIMYWGNKDNPRFLRVRLIHDDEDFGIGNIFSIQEENEALTSMNFATDGGDYHISIDRIKDSKFNASNVRLRFEMSDQNLVQKISLAEDGFSLQDHALLINIIMSKAVFGDMTIKMEKGHDSHLSWVDYIIYQGKEKTFDLAEMQEACFAWHTEIRSSSQQGNISRATLTQSESQVELKTESISLTIPYKPDVEKRLQKSFISKRFQ